MKKFVSFWTAYAPCFRFGVVAKSAVLMSLVVFGMMGIENLAHGNEVTVNY